MSTTPTTEPIAIPATAPFESPPSPLETDPDVAVGLLVGSEIDATPDPGLGRVVAPEDAADDVCSWINTVSLGNERAELIRTVDSMIITCC
jgi:hypothetical protein